MARQVMCCTNGSASAVTFSACARSRTEQVNSFFVSNPRTQPPFASRYKTCMEAQPSIVRLSPAAETDVTSGVTIHFKIFWISAQ